MKQVMAPFALSHSEITDLLKQKALMLRACAPGRFDLLRHSLGILEITEIDSVQSGPCTSKCDGAFQTAS